ncbi:enoyl-CoA hydratase [Bradyrhizobium sp. CCBAU 21360]|uniref:enoyl-CoA hydratase n=1 Tax=Bradyrhizobium sp. CCBAU 21360 TaxID=1325081 RepID=UPI0023055401|nr:enoyl-CoA hydratase [Bradyrhizobium sp. CCBAU 21360]
MSRSRNHADIFCDARGIATITIRDAGPLNILSKSTMADLTMALNAVAVDSALRAVVLRSGNNEAFVAGADIREMADLDATGATEFITHLYDLCEAARNCPVPVIARLSGWCLGGGLQLAASCDIRLASTTARFGMPEVRIGMASMIHAALIPKLAGDTQARWLLLTGETISAVDALQCGLVTKVVACAELDKAVESTIGAIVSCGPASVRTQKALLRAWQTAPIDDAISDTIPMFAKAYETGEPQHFLRRFLAERSIKRESRS